MRRDAPPPTRLSVHLPASGAKPRVDFINKTVTETRSIEYPFLDQVSVRKRFLTAPRHFPAGEGNAPFRPLSGGRTKQSSPDELTALEEIATDAPRLRERSAGTPTTWILAARISCRVRIVRVSSSHEEKPMEVGTGRTAARRPTSPRRRTDVDRYRRHRGDPLGSTEVIDRPGSGPELGHCARMDVITVRRTTGEHPSPLLPSRTAAGT
jgi:hypothetical protein